MGDLIWVGNTLMPREAVFWIVTAGLCSFVILATLIYNYGIKLWAWLFWRS